MYLPKYPTLLAKLSIREWAGGGVFFSLVGHFVPVLYLSKRGSDEILWKPRAIAREATNNLFSSQTCIKLNDFKYVLVFNCFSSCLTLQRVIFPLLIKESVIMYLHVRLMLL